MNKETILSPIQPFAIEIAFCYIKNGKVLGKLMVSEEQIELIKDIMQMYPDTDITKYIIPL